MLNPSLNKLSIRGTTLYLCLKHKNTHDHNWINKKYSIEDVLDDSNLGINLGQSNLIDDLDCPFAVYFGGLWLPHITLKVLELLKIKKK